MSDDQKEKKVSRPTAPPQNTGGQWGAQGTQGIQGSQGQWGAQGTQGTQWGAQGIQGQSGTQGTQWGANQYQSPGFQQGGFQQQQGGFQQQQGGFQQGGFQQGGFQQGGLQQGGFQPQGFQGQTNINTGLNQWGQSLGQQAPNQGFNQGTNNQGFGQSLFNPNIDYVIQTGLKQGMLLDVSGKNDQHINKMIIWKAHKQPNQLFRFVLAAPNKYQIISSLKGNPTVEVPGNSRNNGTQIHISQRNNTQNQYWEIYPSTVVKDAFHIRAFNGKVLDVFEQNKSKGTPVIQWDYNGGKNQCWFIKPASAYQS